MNTYKRNITIERGQGSYIYDTEGTKYLDLVGGLATCSVGHSNQEVLDTIAKQASTLINVTNIFHTKPQQLLAKKLCELGGMSRCFFSNSGAEAIECAIKLAKKYTGKHNFVAMKNSFHGRTLGSLSATYKEAYKTSFMPLVPGFSFVEYGSMEQIKSAVNDDTAGIILELIQGEAGIIDPPIGFVNQLADYAKEANILLIVDEIQTGNGRTGKYFCYQHYDIIPDIVTTAKGLANGLPIGATLSKNDIDFSAGDHGSTFGGNSFCCSVGLKTVEIIEKLMPVVKEKSDYFISKLKEINNIKEIRGMGLMIGVGVDNAMQIAEKSIENGLLLNCPNPETLRFLPPLSISKEEIDFAVGILKKLIDS
jgi:acetylornithine/N-succinyldiaminopimelate aminotransferase